MKQGTSRTVIVSDLVVSDGPFQDAARDFVTGHCSMCRMTVLEQDARFHDAGYLCADCWQYAAGIVH